MNVFMIRLVFHENVQNRKRQYTAAFILSFVRVRLVLFVPRCQVRFSFGVRISMYVFSYILPCRHNHEPISLHINKQAG